MNTKPHGEHPYQAAHQAKGLEFYALKSDGTWTGPHPTRARASEEAGEGGKVAKLNPHLTPSEADAQDAAEVAG